MNLKQKDEPQLSSGMFPGYCLQRCVI